MTREITIETTETILTRDSSSITPSRCHKCAEPSCLVPIEEIVATLGIGAAALHRWLNEGRVHFQPSEKGGLAICWNTLSALLEQLGNAAKQSPLGAPDKMLPPTKRIDLAPDPAKSRGPRRPS